jgi:hypothetical protein
MKELTTKKRQQIIEALAAAFDEACSQNKNQELIDQLDAALKILEFDLS